jgi:endonuclease YncB( thermonuclease family)
VADEVGRAQAREFITEGKNEARLDTRVTNEFDTTTRPRDVDGDTVRVEQARRVSIEGDHHRVKTPLLGDVARSPNHLHMPAVNGVELSDGDRGGLHSIAEFGQRARDNHVRTSFRERVYR